MQERKNSEAGNEKEVDYGRKSGQDNTSENVIENRPEKRVKNKGGNKTGEFIARKRKERGMTQKEMAELLGVTNKAVSKWETSQGMPDIGILRPAARSAHFSGAASERSGIRIRNLSERIQDYCN